MTPPSPLPAWWLAACRKRFGLSKTRPAGMPKPAPKWALEEWDKFIRWQDWLDHGRPKPRPKTFWGEGHVPQWAYVIRHELQLRKKPPAPKPAPPPDFQLMPVPAIFKQKGMLSTWAPQNGSPDPVTLAAQCRQAGCQWVAFQWNEANVPRLVDYIDAARAVGLEVGMWEQQNDTHRPADAVYSTIGRYRLPFYIVCVEGDYSPFNPTRLRELAGNTYPLGLLTTWVGLNEAEKNKPWIAARYTCMTESYSNQDPNAAPGSGDRMAYWRGWPPWKVLDSTRPLEAGLLHTVPCIGLYWDADFAIYRDALKPWGDAFNAYTIETTTEQNRHDMNAA